MIDVFYDYGGVDWPLKVHVWWRHAIYFGIYRVSHRVTLCILHVASLNRLRQGCRAPWIFAISGSRGSIAWVEEQITHYSYLLWKPQLPGVSACGAISGKVRVDLGSFAETKYMHGCCMGIDLLDRVCTTPIFRKSTRKGLSLCPVRLAKRWGELRREYGGGKGQPCGDALRCDSVLICVSWRSFELLWQPLF